MYLLIVDDDKLICENIKSKLIRLKYQERYTIITAYNATEAEILYDKHNPQIVITDIHMPGINGLVLIERLLKKEHQAKTFVLSGFDDYEYVRKAFLLGVTDYMLKPVDIEELHSKLSKIEITPLVDSLNSSETKQANETEDIMRIALNYIDLNVSKPITMRNVADSVGLSYNYFSKLFKQYTNSHFADYIHMRRIEEAKKYLSDPSFKIQEIAKKLGYENPSEFSRAFKKYAGCYPTELRGKI
ncbi:MAG: response regulator [Oscillospiraceae bacterium]